MNMRRVVVTDLLAKRNESVVSSCHADLDKTHLGKAYSGNGDEGTMRVGRAVRRRSATVGGRGPNVGAVLASLLLLVAAACASSNDAGVGSTTDEPISEQTTSVISDSKQSPTAAPSPPAPAAAVDDDADAVDAVDAVDGGNEGDDPAPADAAESPTAGLVLDLPDFDEAGNLELARLGSFVVAKEGAGIQREAADGLPARFDMPVYDSPLGPPRTLLHVNDIEGVSLPSPLINWSDVQGVLVMRVIAGTPDDDWLIVQAPTRPHNQYVWVRRSDFDFGFTNQRIEIDLADEGELILYDGSEEVLRTGIVHGRDTRETPVHLTYIESGIRNAPGELSPAYGTAILSMASFSESLGTFGGGGLPSNFIHGTNQPELMGQQVSSGEIRVPNEVLDQIVERVTPGTPVLLFTSSDPDGNKESILEHRVGPAATMPFEDGAVFVLDATTMVTPKLWTRCPSTVTEHLVCRMGLDPGDEIGSSLYLVAKPDAGEFNDEVNAKVIPVYDLPGGEPRMLLHQPAAAERILRMPLRHPVRSGDPLVLRPLEVSPDGQWIRVDAPVRPQRQSVWVRAEDFTFEGTDYRIEIDIGEDQYLALFDGETEVIRNEIVSGRESRPTVLGASYVAQVQVGAQLSPAYGSYVVSFPIFSDELPTFGGGALPNQAIHGTNQPELMGQRVSSGNIRLPNEVLSFIVERTPELLGARVLVFDSSTSGGGRDVIFAEAETVDRLPASTTDPNDREYEIGVPLF